METEYDRTIEDHGKTDHDFGFSFEDASMTAERETGLESRRNLNRSVAVRPGSDLLLDERLTSAAAPFLSMLSIVLISIAGYFVYLFLHR